MANIILPAVPVLNEIDSSTKLLIEQAGEINRYPISDLDIGGGDVTIEIDPSAKEKPQSPLYSTSNDTHFYPLTTADQVILDDGNRLDDEISKYLTVKLEGEAVEPNPINADTLGGYAAEEYVRKDQYGIELNYSVVGGMEEPMNPTQNMIWIQTETPIGRVFFGNDEPNETFMEGDVWIHTGSSSSVSFNSLKIGNNYMDMVYPLSAKQMTGGVLVAVTVMSYQIGKWSDWIIRLYKNGDECTNITGGWTSSEYTYNNQSVLTATKGTNKITLDSVSNYVACLGTKDPISLDAVSTIEVDVNIVKINSSYPGGNGAVVVSRTKNYSLNGVKAEFGSTTGEKTVMLDVSNLTGEWFVIVTTSLSVPGSTTDVSELRMK